MTTTSDSLVDLVVAALRNRTGAGANVFVPRTWPTAQDLMPIILVQSPHEEKHSEGRSAPFYTVTTTVRVIARVTALTDNGERGTIAAQGALAKMQRQIEVAVINNAALYQVIQQISAIRAGTKVSSDGEQPIGELTMDFDLEFVQTAADFAQPDTDPIEEIAIYSDLVNVFDPNGSYSNPTLGETVAPAPRTSGPDGRVEAAAILDVPTD
ncbi:MAG TPA: hypothetical protein VHW02_07860 [Rhizomicrobium sp.]|nr:hypothetical protein [Rhizomicrobium sp.]